MKSKIREGIFETNSSSVHSLVFLNQKLSKPNLRELRIDKNGIIKIPFGYFGKDYRIYSSQKEKLSYILTFLWCYLDNDFENNYKSSYWQDIKEKIINYINTSCPNKHCVDIVPVYPKKKIKNTDSYYNWIGFDHQTYPSHLEDCVVNLYNPQQVLEFIFNKNIGLETNSD